MVSPPDPTAAPRGLRAPTRGGTDAGSAAPGPRRDGVRGASLMAWWQRPPHPIVLSVVLIVPALIALSRRFDGLYGQDPFAYYDYAVGPLRASLSDFAAPPPFHWPPGYPLLVALASFITGPQPLAGQAVSLLAGALVPLLTALLAREVWPPSRSSYHGDMSPRAALTVPFIAGALVACAPQLWQSSIVVMSDTAGLAAATGGAWALLRYGRTRRGGWLALAAVCLACAILTRWAYALVALPCVAYTGWLVARSVGPERLRMVRHAIGAGAFGAALLAPLIWAALPALLPAASRDPSFAADLLVYRWRPLNMVRRDFATADGRLTYILPNGVYYATLLARPLYFTPVLAWPLLLGLWRALRRPTPQLLLITGWLAVVLAFHAGTPWQNVRFALACAPPCAILIALGLASIHERGGRPARLAAITLLALGLAWMLVTGPQLLDNFIDRKEADVAVARTIAAPPDARLLTFGLTLTLRHYTSYEVIDLSTVDPAALAFLLADTRPTLVLLDVTNIERQWGDRPLGANYRWLRDHGTLTPAAKHGRYTLFATTQP